MSDESKIRNRPEISVVLDYYRWAADRSPESG